MSAGKPPVERDVATLRSAEWGPGEGRIGSAALTANKAVRPRRKTGTGPTESLSRSDPA